MWSSPAPSGKVFKTQAQGSNMVAVAFDTLQFARRLKDVGVPDEQAETQAELMGEAFGFYVNDLVTRDYLDATLDARFAQQDARFDARFAEQDARFDARFAEQDARFDARFADHDAQFAEIRTDLRWHKWLLLTIAASTVIPAFVSLVR